MKLRAVLGRVLLALLLACAGEQTVLHELQHAFERLAQGPSRDHPQHEVCVTCVALGGLHNLAGVAHVFVPVDPVRHARPADVAFRSAHPVFHPVYRSRAPPVLPA